MYTLIRSIHIFATKKILTIVGIENAVFTYILREAHLATQCTSETTYREQILCIHYNVQNLFSLFQHICTYGNGCLISVGMSLGC